MRTRSKKDFTRIWIHVSYVSEFAMADWFGLITGTVVATSSDVFISRNSDERTFFIGNRHPLLFKYEICKIDRNGTVQETVSYIIYIYICTYRHRFDEIHDYSFDSDDHGN